MQPDLLAFLNHSGRVRLRPYRHISVLCLVSSFSFGVEIENQEPLVRPADERPELTGQPEAQSAEGRVTQGGERTAVRRCRPRERGNSSTRGSSFQTPARSLSGSETTSPRLVGEAVQHGVIGVLGTKRLDIRAVEQRAGVSSRWSTGMPTFASRRSWPPSSGSGVPRHASVTRLLDEADCAFHRRGRVGRRGRSSGPGKRTALSP